MGRVRALLVFVLCLSPVLGQQEFFFPQVADGEVAGAIRFQTSFIFVNTGADTTVTLELFSTPDGTPMEFTLLEGGGQQMGPASSFDIALNQGQSFSAQTPGTGTIQVGYARITTGDGVGGTAVFTRSDPVTGVVLYEAGVPATRTASNFSLFVDSTGNRDTGLAVITPPGQEEAMLSVELFDKDFNPIMTTPVPLQPGGHFARFISEIFGNDPATRGIEGTLTVSATGGQVAAVTLRTNDGPLEFPEEVPTLTTFPVVTGTTQAAGTFAVQAGGEIEVSLRLSGETGTVVGVIYQLYDDAGGGQRITRGVAEARTTHALPVPAGMGRLSRVAARLIYAGGHLGPAFDLAPSH